MHKSPEWLFVEPGSNKCSCGKILHPWRLWYDWCKYALGTCVCLHLSAGMSNVDLTLQHCGFSHHLFLCLIYSQPVSCLFSSCSVGPNKCIWHHFFMINFWTTTSTLICWWLTAADMNISSVICSITQLQKNIFDWRFQCWQNDFCSVSHSPCPRSHPHSFVFVDAAYSMSLWSFPSNCHESKKLLSIVCPPVVSSFMGQSRGSSFF